MNHVSISVRPTALLIATMTFLAILPGSARAEEPPTPTVVEQIIGLEAMCAEHSDAIAARQTEKSLYDRLGGEEKIHEIVVEIIRLHGINDPIKRTLEGVDEKHLVHGVTQFLVAGSGGPTEYEGRNMTDAHAHLELTNADFLAAGSDVMKAMETKGCGEAEIQEVICVLVGLREQVVIATEQELH